MRVLITGVAGFLGSHLADRFIAEGHEVVGIDNFLTGTTENIEHLFGNEQFHFIRHDVTEFMYVKGPLDGVLHLASPASPIDYLKLPIQTLKVGSLGTHKALGLSLEKKARFLISSTSEVYGDPQVHPQREDYWGHVNPIGPRGVYDEAKRFAEAITMAYHRYHGLDVRIARIFNTYGPRMRLDDGRVVSNFVVQALQDKPLTVYGDGTQTRSFCYMDDLVDGLYRLFHSDRSMPTNLGNPVEFSILELIETLERVVGRKLEVVHEALPEDDPQVRQPDISAARKDLDWEPEVSLEEGLRRSLPYFQERLASSTPQQENPTDS